MKPNESKRRRPFVSIHAFRGEGDAIYGNGGPGDARFNPRLPGGRRPNTAIRLTRLGLFQSTPSGGKATERNVKPDHLASVSIHAFRGEGDLRLRKVAAPQVVSIHAFRGEGDAWLLFLKFFDQVSIHAFRGEGDLPHLTQLVAAAAVSIHAFRGEGDRNI